MKKKKKKKKKKMKEKDRRRRKSISGRLNQIKSEVNCLAVSSPLEKKETLMKGIRFGRMEEVIRR